MKSENSSPDKFRPAVADFMESMTAVFKTPYNLKGDRIAISLRNYGEVLEKYDDPTLADLWLRARTKFSGQWPSIKELAETAGEICGEVAVKENKYVHLNAAFRTPQGKHALENGTGIRFKHACQKLGWVIGMELTERLVRQTRSECEGHNAERLQAHQDRERECREEYG